MRLYTSKTILALGGAAFALVFASAPALADKIRHPTAVFAGLDKITGRIIAFDVATDETVQFGSLQITPRICYTRPQTEAPLTDGFVEVDEIQEERKFKRIFSGWMFAASPGLHGVEHPVYDVWLTDCKGGTELIRGPVEATDDKEPPPNADVRTGAQPKPARRRVDPNAAQQGGQPGAAPPLGAPVNVQPAPGQAQPAPERRAPTRRFYPNDAPAIRDPAGN